VYRDDRREVWDDTQYSLFIKDIKTGIDTKVYTQTLERPAGLGYSKKGDKTFQFIGVVNDT